MVLGKDLKMKPILVTCFLLCFMLVGLVRSQLTFTNPILDRNSADPSILRVGDSYYLTLSENTETELTIFKSPVLTSFRNAEKKIAYIAPPGYSELWASEMHLVDGELYIYFTMRDGNDHRMYVIKAENASDPMGNWGEAIRLLPDWNPGAIDGTVMNHDNRHYFLWAGWATTGHLSIYIAPMANATYVTGPVVLLREPREEWECQGGCTNEGPFFIYNRGVSYMVFSASSTWDAGYCLSYMSVEAGKDPMMHWNWVSVPGPVFERNDEEDVYTTGHAAFTTSPDGTETWMAYHGTIDTTNIDGFRIARIEKIDWNSDGTPSFPIPHGFNHPQPVPSGQTSV